MFRVRLLMMFAVLCAGSALSGCATTPRPSHGYDRTPIGAVAEQSAAVQAANERIAQAGYAETIARSEFLPELSLKGTYASYLNDKSGSTPRTGTASTTLSLDVPITAGIAGFSNAKSATSSRYAAAAGQSAVQSDMLLRITRAIASRNKALSVLLLLEEQDGLLRKHVQRMSQRHKAGETPASAINQLKARVAALGAQTAQARAELAAAEAELAATGVDGSFDGLRLVALEKHLPASEDEAVAIALRENPRVKEAGWQAEASRQSATASVLGAGPDLSMSLNANMFDYNYTDNTTTTGDSMDVRLQLSVPLFDGGKRASKVGLAQAAYREKDFESRALRSDTVGAVRSSWKRFEGYRASHGFAKERVNRAQAAYNGIAEGQRLGTRRSDEALSAFNELTDARIALETVRYQVTINLHELFDAMGRLPTLYGVR